MADLETKTAPASRPDAADERTRESDPPDEAFPTGARLGRYEVLFPLASGGMGTVYAGRLVGAHGFDRLVAIKAMRRADREHVDAFLDEARVTAQISHPNVIEVHEFGEHGGAPFIIMQLVQGASLASLIERMNENDERIPTELAIWIAVQAAAGLHAAHELTDADGERLGLVHRDVSPHNILLSYEGRVYVADFGVAKLTTDAHQTVSGVIKGKFGYMAPEQAEARAVDQRADVFALGIVLYEALTGERLFGTDSPSATLLRVIREAAPDVRDRRPGVPEDIAKIVARCLEKEPDDRYATAAEVAEALRAAAREHGLLADDQELVDVLAEAFAEEKQAMRERLRGASSPRHSRPEIPGPDPGDISTLSEHYRTKPSAETPEPPRRGVSVIALAVVGVVVIVVAALAFRRPSAEQSEANAPKETATTFEPAAPAAPAQAPATAEQESRTAPADELAVEPEPPAPAEDSEGAAPHATSKPAATPAAPPKLAPPPTPEPRSSAPPSSKEPSKPAAGKPFTDLGL